ncbi:Dyp-type peroxidase [Pelomonas aquatica]|jgi:Dyp-type peroxidase family|uniref:Dyp-type peroxidase n=1 Tax=Pelomonas aquatica TaxID=431058 RepID=A0A9X4LKY1_9BURK|nr:Dyp-type peroxidase [Pelomonas aquatica]MCY4753017.1 Dyp-type peroxidase [Pelomonas aquatica]MDG0862043.1 Dyp-type peroxidase [Pelomonas aquatica]
MARGNDVQLGGITDLVLLADIKPGFVDALEVATHVDRLRKVLRTLNGLRLGSRESSAPASRYSDIVARWRIVHSFRWAVVDGRDGVPDRLLLNVNFDGGWEPYMRVIWDQLGSTLDLILCHAEGYELSCNCSFEAYARWVRAHEVSADFLFIESGRSVSDAEYLSRLEAAQRGHASELGADRLRAPAAGEVAPLPTDPAERFAMAARGLVPLAGLYTLQRYFNDQAWDGRVLLRATQDVLFELTRLGTREHFPVGTGSTPGEQLRRRHFAMLQWFESTLTPPAVQARELPLADADLQAGLLTRLPANRGALLLMRVAQPGPALAWLSTAPVTAEGQQPPQAGPLQGVWTQVALTLAGLGALGLPPARLERFPQAFKEGMAARAGLLGDVRHNHPAHWALAPHVNGRDRFDPAGAHLLVQLRFASPEPGEVITQADRDRIDAVAQALTQGTGLALMAVEPLRGSALEQESFGFKDGISQPVPDWKAPQPTGQRWDDRVRDGEVLQGYATARDKGYAVPEQPDALLDRGSFLAVRKLRQYVGRLDARMAAEARRTGLPKELLLAKLMGRWRTGEPLADDHALNEGNDFNYEADAKGALCPFHAHIRRTNPRDLGADQAFAKARMPRILRRGMSYGPPPDRDHPADDADRGLIFMAYNAHLAEQFEVIQRWVAGGNASGGYSAQSDPLLGVVDPGAGPRLYPFEHDKRAYEIDLGPEPFVTLQWGAYFFVPSIRALKALPGLVELPLPQLPAAALPAAMPARDDFAAWQGWLEDPNRRDAAWAWVRQQPGGVVATAYGVLVGAADRVQEVLRNAPDRYSVAGYGERMADSVGVGYLGLDDDSGHREQAPAVNKILEGVSEADSFMLAYQVASAGIAGLRQEAQALLAAFPPGQKPADLPTDTPLDLERLSEGVLAKLCQIWFGPPDGRYVWGTEFHPPGEAEAPRCPAALFRVSRYVFGPHPTPAVCAAGRQAGSAFTEAVDRWLAATPFEQLPKLSQAILAAAGAVPGAPADLPTRMLAGIMLGFPPTTHANLLATLAIWVQTRKLWDLQPQWHEVPATASLPERYTAAVARLRPALVATLNYKPTPFQVWRRSRADHRLGGVDVKAGDTLVVALGSATQQDPLRHHIAFGGDRADPAGPPPHACPGYGMGMGVMLGVIAAVLDAGVLRFTGAPTVVALSV